MKNTLIIPFVFLATGFVSAYFIFDKSETSAVSTPIRSSNISSNPITTTNNEFINNERFNNLESEIVLIKQQIKNINLSLQKLTENSITKSPTISSTKKHTAPTLKQRSYSLDNLIRGGIAPALAEEIIRRKNSLELKRLALQDHATRENYLNTQQYFDELEEIDKQNITLREELGDEQYDTYLFSGKQNNRIRILSVMLGSAAEQAGIQKGDIILSYDNNRLFNWQELKNATSEGQLGEYVSISINRKGEIFSFSVPRGPLGMQLGAARLQP